MKRYLVLIFIALFGAFFSVVYAEKLNKDEDKKSPPYFKVYVEDGILYLNPLRTSVSVQIINEWGAIVYEEFISVDQPQLYMIPVDHLPCGSYTVLIVGEQGNYQFDFYF